MVHSSMVKTVIYTCLPAFATDPKNKSKTTPLLTSKVDGFVPAVPEVYLPFIWDSLEVEHVNLTVLSVGCADNTAVVGSTSLASKRKYTYLDGFTTTGRISDSSSLTAVCGVSSRLEVEGSQQLLLQTSVGQRVRCEAPLCVLPCRALSLGAKNSSVVFKSLSLQGKKTSNFLDLRGVMPGERSVFFKVGLDLRRGSRVRRFLAPVPSGTDWDLWRPATTSAQFAELQHGLDLSYKKLWSESTVHHDRCFRSEGHRQNRCSSAHTTRRRELSHWFRSTHSVLGPILVLTLCIEDAVRAKFNLEDDLFTSFFADIAKAYPSVPRPKLIAILKNLVYRRSSATLTEGSWNMPDTVSRTAKDTVKDGSKGVWVSKKVVPPRPLSSQSTTRSS